MAQRERKGNLKKPAKEEAGQKDWSPNGWIKIQWIGQIKTFFREVRIELKKVTWPSRKETIAATAMVIILSVLVAFFLGFLDVGLSQSGWHLLLERSLGRKRRGLEHKWYIVHTYSGFEHKVKLALEEHIKSLGKEDLFSNSCSH